MNMVDLQGQGMIIIMIAVIFIAPYLTDKAGPIALHKINIKCTLSVMFVRTLHVHFLNTNT